MPVPVPIPVPNWAGRERKGPRGGLCPRLGTCQASQGDAAWVVARGRRWEQLWHQVLARVSEEVGAGGAP